MQPKRRAVYYKETAAGGDALMPPLCGRCSAATLLFAVAKIELLHPYNTRVFLLLHAC